MNFRRSLLSLSLVAAGSLFFAGAVRADDHHEGDHHEGEELNVHNHTGHEVVVFLFQDDHVHLDEGGGTQLAHIKDGESAVAHVPNCKFSILLVDHDDVWHAELHDCSSTELTFSTDTGHAKKKH